MQSRLPPHPDALRIAERALGMKISVDAILAVIEEERDKYRQRVRGVLDASQKTIDLYGMDDDVTDEDFEEATHAESMLGDGILDRLYKSLTARIETVRKQIDGLLLSAMTTNVFDGVPASDRDSIVAKILNIATGQSLELLKLDPIEDAYLCREAKEILQKRLGFLL